MSRSTIAGIGVAAVLIGGAGFAIVSPRALGTRYHEFQITFPTADGLVSGSDVLEAGSKIGTISAIQPTQDNTALVTVEIADDHWPLHSGTTADIRPKSLLGEKYVDVHDGGASNPALDTAVVLHETEKAVPVELDQFVNSLDEPTRNAARVLLDDLGAGVAGRGQSLNDAIAAGRADLQNLAVFGTTLNNRDADLDRILVGLDGVLGKISSNDQLTQMSQLITNGQQTLDAIETQQAAFSRGFVDAQTALGELNTAIDGAVPSLHTTLVEAPQLLNLTGEEGKLLAFLGGIANNTTVLDSLNAGLVHGPTTTGGALEHEGGSAPAQSIFRICLANPGNAGTSCQGSVPASISNSAGSDSTPTSYSTTGQGDDMAMLAFWLAD